MNAIFLHPEDFDPKCARCGYGAMAHDVDLDGALVCGERCECDGHSLPCHFADSQYYVHQCILGECICK